MRRLPLRSPPRMRGKVPGRTAGGCPGGITPACAGKSAPAASSATECRDHPRVCGEKPSSNCCLLITSGSPPRMRGKGSRKTHFQPHLGITPAYAGKSVSRGHAPPAGRDYPRVCGEKCGLRRSASAMWDHPRVCGEKPRIFFMSIRSAGSPPRMRGKADAKSSGRYSRPLHGTPVSLDALR